MFSPSSVDLAEKNRCPLRECEIAEFKIDRLKHNFDASGQRSNPPLHFPFRKADVKSMLERVASSSEQV